MRSPDVYARKLDVLNRGLSGYNTDWALPVLEQVSVVNVRKICGIKKFLLVPCD